jgi:hypothetical protein
MAHLNCVGGDWQVIETCSMPSNGMPTCDKNSGCDWECNDGYCPSGNSCVDTKYDMDNCGSCGYACTIDEVDNSTAVTCMNGQCIAEGCETGYHEYNGTCEANSFDHCGSHLNSCAAPCGGFDCNASTGRCESTGYCSGGCHLNQGVCVLDECTDGAYQCYGNEIYQYCSDGEWEDDETCTSPTNGSPLCNDSTGWDWTCDTGYCKGTGFNCVSKQTDMNNCGTCGSVCNTSKVKYSTRVTCASGKCIAQACQSGYRVSNGLCVIDGNSCETTGYQDVKYELDDGTVVDVAAYCISKEEDLKAIAEAVNGGGAYPPDNGDNAYIMIQDIDLSSGSWVPIGTSSNPFRGTFWADGYYINTTTPLEADQHNFSIFGYIQNAVIYNIYLNIDINGNRFSGVSALVANAESSHLQEIQVESAHLMNVDSQSGAIVAVDSGSTIYYSYARDLVIEAVDSDDIGGLVGDAENTQFYSCYVQDAEITATCNAGGLVGYSGNGFTVVDSYVENSAMHCGGECGGVAGCVTSPIFENVYANNITIESNGGYTGGFVGDVVYGSFDRCYSNVNLVESGCTVGGFSGYSTDSNYESCGALGAVSAACEAGGFVGSASGNDWFSNCYSMATVNGNNDVSGSFAGLLTNATLNHSYAFGDVFCDIPDVCGAFAGLTGGTSTVDNSYYNKDLEIFALNPMGLAVGSENEDLLVELKPFYIEGNNSLTDGSTLRDALGDPYMEKTCNIGGTGIKLPVISGVFPRAVCE